MRVERTIDGGVFYTSFMGSGEEINRLIKRLWGNPYYDFSFISKPICAINRIYQLHIAFNYISSRYDVDLVGQETVNVILKDANVKIIASSSFAYGKE